MTAATTDVLVVAYGIPGMPREELKEGLTVAANYIRRFAGGEIVMDEF